MPFFIEDISHLLIRPARVPQLCHAARVGWTSWTPALSWSCQEIAEGGCPSWRICWEAFHSSAVASPLLKRSFRQVTGPRLLCPCRSTHRTGALPMASGLRNDHPDRVSRASSRRGGCHLPMADGTRAILPEWMLDPVACAAIKLSSPVILLRALEQLHRLLVDLGSDERTSCDPVVAKEVPGDYRASRSHSDPATAHRQIDRIARPESPAGAKFRPYAC